MTADTDEQLTEMTPLPPEVSMSNRFPGWGTEKDIADAIQRAIGCEPENAEDAADDVVKLLRDRGIEI